MEDCIHRVVRVIHAIFESIIQGRGREGRWCEGTNLFNAPLVRGLFTPRKFVDWLMYGTDESEVRREEIQAVGSSLPANLRVVALLPDQPPPFTHCTYIP
jgi:hypothetical protein